MQHPAKAFQGLTIPSLAYAEMKLILARMLFEFEFELYEPNDNWSNQRVFTLWEKRPLMLKIAERRH
jgi:cytochrome P450